MGFGPCCGRSSVSPQGEVQASRERKNRRINKVEVQDDGVIGQEAERAETDQQKKRWQARRQMS